jgi:hypothetical protein
MGAKDGVLLLFEGAEVTATEFDESVYEIHRLMHENGGKAVFIDSLRIATVKIESATVGVFSIFEARMQPNLPKGTFFR